MSKIQFYHIVDIKINNEILCIHLLYYVSNCRIYVYSTSQFGLVSFYVLSCHMWLVAAIPQSIGVNYPSIMCLHVRIY